MSKPSIAGVALATVAIEAQRLAKVHRASNDQQLALAFDEIATMLLGVARDATSPLMEVATERQQSHHRGGKIDFLNRRLLLVTLVMREMETKGCTRYAACKRVSSLVFKRNGKARIESAAKELARHVPLTIAEFQNSEIGREAASYRKLIRDSLQTKMADGSSVPDELVYFTLASLYSEARANEQQYVSRVATLRELFNSSTSNLPEFDVEEIGDDILSRLIAELRPISKVPCSFD